MSGLLTRHRGDLYRLRLPRLQEEQILAWAEAYRERTRAWPNQRSGPIPEAPGTTWRAIDLALHQGGRGLPGGSSLYRFLQQQRPPR